MVSSSLEHPRFIITEIYYGQHIPNSPDVISYSADEVLFLFSWYHKMTAGPTYVHSADRFQSLQTQTIQIV